MNQILIVADESVDFRVVTHLRASGLKVYSILENDPSISDVEVLQLAVDMDALLITEDKDFGELVVRLQLAHRGVLLIRVISLPIEGKLKRISDTIVRHYDELVNVFSVLSDAVIRIRK